MKKKLLILLSICIIILAFPLGVFAAQGDKLVYKEYDFALTMTEWGAGVNPAGVWAFEYWDFADDKFKLMEYWQDAGGINTYFEAIMPPDSTSDYHYARHRSNSSGMAAVEMHPGNQAEAVRAFVCPAEGKVDYTVTIARNNTVTTNDGNNVSIYLNDTLIWPTAAYLGREFVDQAAVDNKYVIIEDNTKPLTVTFTGIDVKEGDRIRLRVGSGGAGNKGSDVCTVQENIVTYTSLAAGYAYGIMPPPSLSSSGITHDTAVIKWMEVADATGYNVYVDGQKANTSAVTELTYTLEGLNPDTSHKITVTSLNADTESDQSGEITVKTKAVPADTTAAAATEADTKPGDTAPGSTTDGSDSTSAAGDTTAAANTDKNDDGLDTTTIIVIIAAAAVVVVVIIVIAANASKKKKK